MATSKSTTFDAKINSQVVGPLHDPIQAIRPYTEEKFNRKNWSAFEFGFVAHLIGYDLVDILLNDGVGKAKDNKIYLIFIASLESSEFVLVNKTSTSAQAWAALKSIYQKKRGQSVLLLTQKFRHAKMVDGEVPYHHLTMISNLANELEDVTSIDITNEDFMTTTSFSIMGIPRCMNIVEIVMNRPALRRRDLINKQTATEQQQKVTNERLPELHTAMRALDKRKKKKKKGTCYNCSKDGYFARECRSKPKRAPKERANKVTGGGTEFVFTTQLGGSQSNKSNKWIVDSGASRHMVSSKTQLIEAEPLDNLTIVVLGDGQSLEATHREKQPSPQTYISPTYYMS
jgi:hypothetical protein